MNHDDLVLLFRQLGERRPIFHSEADFQHDLAWEFRAQNLARQLRLERPFRVGERPAHVDLVAATSSGLVGIELK